MRRARGEARELPVFIPSLALSTDNAAMIAAAGPAPAFALGDRRALRWDLQRRMPST